MSDYLDNISDENNLQMLSFFIKISVPTFAGRGRATPIKVSFNWRTVSMHKKNNIYKNYHSTSTSLNLEIVYSESKKERRKTVVKKIIFKIVDYIIGGIIENLINLF